MNEREASFVTALYNGCVTELNRLRDLEWRLTIQFASIFVGLTLFALEDNAAPVLRNDFGKVLAGLGFIAFLFYSYHLLKTHGYLRDQRELRSKLERLMRFHEAGVYTQEGLLPGEWKTQKRWFEVNSVVVPLGCSVLLAYLIFAWVITTR